MYMVTGDRERSSSSLSHFPGFPNDSGLGQRSWKESCYFLRRGRALEERALWEVLESQV